LIDCTDNDNLKSRFDRSKVKCYNFPKRDHYTRDCWSLTKKVKENANLVIKEENEATLLPVHDKRIQGKENM